MTNSKRPGKPDPAWQAHYDRWDAWTHRHEPRDLNVLRAAAAPLTVKVDAGLLLHPFYERELWETAHVRTVEDLRWWEGIGEPPAWWIERHKPHRLTFGYPPAFTRAGLDRALNLLGAIGILRADFDPDDTGYWEADAVCLVATDCDCFDVDCPYDPDELPVPCTIRPEEGSER
jgi:hypothetical protein